MNTTVIKFSEWQRAVEEALRERQRSIDGLIDAVRAQQSKLAAQETQLTGQRAQIDMLASMHDLRHAGGGAKP